MIDYFFVSLIFLSSFYSIYLEKFWNNFYTRNGIHVSIRFLYTVDTGGGDGAANFAELDSDFSEPGKHVWTFDMAEVLHVHVKVCVWHMSVGKYLVARKATTRLFRSCDDL